jgi:hypothetical protein
MITLGFKQKSSDTPRSRRRQPRIDLFLEMCHQVLEFAGGHGQQGVEIFFAINGKSIGLYLMTKAEAYDFELSRKLTDFAAPYIDRGLLESVTLLPASSTEELEAFFDPEKALRVEIKHA